LLWPSERFCHQILSCLTHTVSTQIQILLQQSTQFNTISRSGCHTVSTQTPILLLHSTQFFPCYILKFSLYIFMFFFGKNALLDFTWFYVLIHSKWIQVHCICSIFNHNLYYCYIYLLINNFSVIYCGFYIYNVVYTYHFYSTFITAHA
jgi:hypothetical protein